MSELKRVYGLDILRAAAILFVVIAHSLYRELHILKLSVFDGVNLFFVLSGFLIGTILIKALNRGLTLAALFRFWYRRWMRTLPAYFVVLTFLVAYSLMIDSYQLFHYAKFYLFVHDVFYLHWQTDVFPESWSLCIEEWFYFIIPLILFFGAWVKIPVKFLLLSTIISVILIDNVLRIRLSAVISDFDTWNVIARQGTIYRLDSIMWGVLAAYLTYYNLFISIKVLFWAGIGLWVASAISFYIPFNPFFNYWFLTMQCIGTFLMIPYMNSIKTGSGIVYRFLTYTATISYSMYLLNLTPYNIISKNFNIGLFNIPLAIVFTYLGAHILYKLVERPFMRLRDRKKRKFQYLVIKG